METARKRAAVTGAEEVLEELYKPPYAYLKQGHVKRQWDDILAQKKDPIADFTLWRNRQSVRLLPASTKRLLEVGIGSGHALRAASEKLPEAELFGTDISSSLVANATAGLKGHFAVADVGQLPWPDVQFDAILMLEVLEHIEVTRTFSVLRWLHDLLKEGGSLILSVPLETVADLAMSTFLCPHCAEPVHPIGHVRSYSDLEPVQAELRLAGFEIERRWGLAGGRYCGVPRQWLMPIFPERIKPMVMIFKCRKGSRG
jgi:SAM-dependent methyltransferase